MRQPSFSEADLQRNLRAYGWVRMLSARVFLPLIAVYLAQVAHLDMAQLGTLGVIAAAVSLVGNIPGGYYADHHTRRMALVTGSVLAALGTVAYVILPSYPGAILATVLDSLGYSFMSGAGEALMHDSLVARSQAQQYVKIIGRAASFAMTGNLVLVGLVPLTYSLDKRLPFLCGTIAYLVFIMMVLALKEPPRPAGAAASPAVAALSRPRRLERLLRQFVTRRTIWLFIAIGLLSSIYVAPVPFASLAQVDLGMPPNLIGLMYAAASLVAAFGGWYLHRLNRLSLLQYALIDIMFAAAQPLAIGIARNLVVTVPVFIATMAFWRFRNIIYQDHMLRVFGHSHHKATLVSIIGFFRDIQMLWLPLVYAFVIHSQGYYRGFTITALVSLVIMPPIFIFAMIGWRRFQLAQA